MKLFRLGSLLALVLTLGAAAPASAQNVTSSDIQRLQDALADATRDVSAARTRDGALASRLESELNDLRDETAYIRVKIRKNEPVARTDYFDLRDRIDELRARARGDDARTTGSASSGSSSSRSTRSSTRTCRRARSSTSGSVRR